VHFSPTQLNLLGLMVSMDARHTGELRFDSLLRHFFKNSNQHLAWPGPPGGVTVRHPHATSTPQWLNGSKKGGYLVAVASAHNECFITVDNPGGKRGVDNQEVEKTTINRVFFSGFKRQQPCLAFCTIHSLQDAPEYLLTDPYHKTIIHLLRKLLY